MGHDMPPSHYHDENCIDYGYEDDDDDDDDDDDGDDDDDDL